MNNSQKKLEFYLVQILSKYIIIKIMSSPYFRNDRFPNHLDRTDRIARVLPFSRVSSNHNIADELYQTPIRKAPSAPYTTFSQRNLTSNHTASLANNKNNYENDSFSRINDNSVLSPSSKSNLSSRRNRYTNINRNSSVNESTNKWEENLLKKNSDHVTFSNKISEHTPDYSQRSNLTKLNDNSNFYSTHSYSNRDSYINDSSKRDYINSNYQYSRNEIKPNDGYLIRRRGNDSTHFLHEEMLRIESQKEDAILQSEKLMVQLDIQKKENIQLEKIISTLREDIAKLNKNAKDSVLDNIEYHIQSQSRNVNELINSNLSSLKENLIAELTNKAPITNEISTKIESVNKTQEKQFDMIYMIHEKLSELLNDSDISQNLRPIALENINRLKNDLHDIVSIDIKEMESTIKYLQDEIQLLKANFEMEQEKINSQLFESIDTLNTENENLKLQLENFEKENVDLVGEIDRLRIDLRKAESRTEYYMKLANHASEIAELKQKSYSNGLNEGISKDIERKSNGLTLNQNDEKLELLRSENKRLTSYQDELLNQISLITKQRDRLKSNLQEIEESSNEERRRLEKEIQILKEQLMNATYPNNDLLKRVDLLEREIEKKDIKIDLLNKKIESTSHQVVQTNNQLHEYKNSHSNDVTSLQIQIQSLKRENEGKEQHVERLLVENQRNKEEEKRLKDTINKQNDIINRLETQIELIKTEKVQESIASSLHRQSLISRSANLRSPL